MLRRKVRQGTNDYTLNEESLTEVIRGRSATKIYDVIACAPSLR